MAFSSSQGSELASGEGCFSITVLAEKTAGRIPIYSYT
jgi:hypothetical protein